MLFSSGLTALELTLAGTNLALSANDMSTDENGNTLVTKAFNNNETFKTGFLAFQTGVSALSLRSGIRNIIKNGGIVKNIMNYKINAVDITSTITDATNTYMGAKNLKTKLKQ